MDTLTFCGLISRDFKLRCLEIPSNADNISQISIGAIVLTLLVRHIDLTTVNLDIKQYLRAVEATLNARCKSPKQAILKVLTSAVKRNENSARQRRFVPSCCFASQTNRPHFCLAVDCATILSIFHL